MATIGLNDGPFLVMTITFENGSLIIADPIESKVPTITLSQADSITLAENFPKLKPKTSPKKGYYDGCKPMEQDVELEVTMQLDRREVIELPYPIVIKAVVWGCEYVVSVFREGETIVMEIYNRSYAVKASFTSDAEEYFEWVLDEITSHNSHVVLD